MATDNLTKLVRILKNSVSWMSASQLALLLNVSNRTIRNYVFRVNKNYKEDTLIESSSLGYRIIDKSVYGACEDDIAQSDDRHYHVMNILLHSTKPISLFELAERLFISESTLNTDLTKVRNYISPYDLSIVTKDFKVSLIGSEVNKRKVIHTLIMGVRSDYFSSADILSEMFEDNPVNILELRETLHQLSVKSGTYLNDYALNSVTIHVVILINRLLLEQSLDNIDVPPMKQPTQSAPSNADKTNEYTSNIIQYLEDDYNVRLNELEKQQLRIMIVSSAYTIDFSNTTIPMLYDFYDANMIELVKKSLEKIEERYYLDDFDSSFFVRIFIHSINMLRRSDFNISYSNPIVDRIKSDYPLVYDMAVFFISELQKNNHKFKPAEDEIGYIAFHIGAYFERKNDSFDKLSCILYSNTYYDYHEQTIKTLKHHFSNLIDIVSVKASEEFNVQENKKVDIIISTSKIPISSDGYIRINPIVSKQDLRNIDQTIRDINLKKEKNYNIPFDDYISKEMYFSDVEFDSKFSCIDMLVNQAIKLGYVDKEYHQDVIAREKLSSTAFGSYIAMPHTTIAYAKKTFFGIIQSQQGIQWDEQNVNFVILVGIAEDDLKSFRHVFNVIVDIFSDHENISILLLSKDYKDFLERIQCISQI